MKRQKRTRKIIYDLNFMRPAKVLVMSAGVMIANFNWNKANNTRGIVGASVQGLPSRTFWNIKKEVGSPLNPP